MKPSEQIQDLSYIIAAKAIKSGEFRDWGNPDQDDKWQALLQYLDTQHDKNN